MNGRGGRSPDAFLMNNDPNVKRCYNLASGKDTLGRVSTAVVHLICNQGVGGSNPSPGTIYEEII